MILAQDSLAGLFFAYLLIALAVVAGILLILLGFALRYLRRPDVKRALSQDDPRGRAGVYVFASVAGLGAAFFVRGLGDRGTVYQGRTAGEWALLMEQHVAYTSWELLPLRTPAAVPVLEEILEMRPVFIGEYRNARRAAEDTLREIRAGQYPRRSNKTQ